MLSAFAGCSRDRANACPRRIFDRTAGHYHFCGDTILFENRGWADKPDG
jgi:hypothetical protein